MSRIQAKPFHVQASNARSRKPAYRVAAALLVGLALGLSAGPIAAAEADAQSAAQSTRSNSARHAQPTDSDVDISAAQAGHAARKQYGGKVLSVTLETGSSAKYYRVKLLSGGQVRVVRISADRE